VAFTLPDLPYSKDALAPYMSAETLDYHHDKHHLAYVDTGNKLIQGTGLEGKSLEEVVVASFKDPKLKKLFNNAGQHWNHLHFWNWMKPKGGGSIPGELEKRLTADFGSLDAFKTQFTEGGVGQFGSGWVWLVEDAGKLAIMATPNGENPVAHGKKTVLGCDVWEHSYYIDYRNRRADYIKAWLDNLVNWEYAAEMLRTGGKVAQAA
jgi:Fe-Mn family superoxide dismutase